MHSSLKRRPRRSIQRGGFTLLELLLVMAILVVLASLSTFAILNLRDSTSQQAAQVQVETLKDACTMFKLSVGRFPNSCLLYTSPSPRDQRGSRMPSSA